MPSAFPILYSFRRCPFAIRARLAIQASAQCCELREVVLREKPESMLQVSSKGTVPVLINVDRSVIDDSLDIMLWALRKNDPFGWLCSETGSISDMIELINMTDGDFKYHLDRYKYSNHYENTNKEFHRDQASQFLDKLNMKVTESSYLFGVHPSLADMAILPFVRQFANVDRSWFDNQDWLKLQAWLIQFTDSDLFIKVMNKYRQWHPGDHFVLFPEYS